MVVVVEGEVASGGVDGGVSEGWERMERMYVCIVVLEDAGGDEEAETEGDWDVEADVEAYVDVDGAGGATREGGGRCASFEDAGGGVGSSRRNARYSARRAGGDEAVGGGIALLLFSGISEIKHEVLRCVRSAERQLSSVRIVRTNGGTLFSVRIFFLPFGSRVRTRLGPRRSKVPCPKTPDQLRKLPFLVISTTKVDSLDLISTRAGRGESTFRPHGLSECRERCLGGFPLCD